MTCREAGPFCPHRLYSKRGGRQIAAPTYATPLRLLFLQCGTWYRASSTAYGGPPSPKGKVMGVIPFNHTSYIRNVAGGRLPPLQTRWWGTVHPHRLYSKRCLAMNHRRYIAWFHSTAQVLFETSRALYHCVRRLCDVSSCPAPWERILEENCVKYM